MEKAYRQRSGEERRQRRGDAKSGTRPLRYAGVPSPAFSAAEPYRNYHRRRRLVVSGISQIVAGMVPPKEMNFRCIHCGFPVETLFIQYSPGNIRLMKCENCRSVADEYIECEIMILLIDLVLHKSKAYHHLLNNFPKLNGVYLETLFSVTNSLHLCLQLLLSSFFGILVFLCILYHACKYLQKSPRKAIR
ncbi:arv1-like protein [Nymphaea thermarum]|nr:arv1-like protein [Nymphaea thermarum]